MQCSPTTTTPTPGETTERMSIVSETHKLEKVTDFSDLEKGDELQVVLRTWFADRREDDSVLVAYDESGRRNCLSRDSIVSVHKVTPIHEVKVGDVYLVDGVFYQIAKSVTYEGELIALKFGSTTGYYLYKHQFPFSAENLLYRKADDA